MATDAWIEFNGQELANLSRTAQLAEALAIPSVWVTPESVQWVQDDLSGTDYDDITEAPWYDPQYAASAEFAGILPLSFPGLDDSTLTSTPVEYVTDGGNSGRPRNATLPIVANVAIIASTDRGAEFGMRWLNRILRNSGSNTFCAGSDLTYFRYSGGGAPKAHRRNVRLTRGASVTRKRRGACDVSWLVTFTLTAADPYEYGEPIAKVEELGGIPTGDIISTGSVTLVEASCPQFDYTPIYDPLHSALIPGPSIPNIRPDGWEIADGEVFDRFWARINPVEPSELNVIPLITLTSPDDVRSIRVSIFPSDADPTDLCGALFVGIVSYIPAGLEFTIDSERQASYVWDGFSEAVRRTDSLVFSPQAGPIQWTAFNDNTNLLFALDVFSGSLDGPGNVRAGLSLIPKSD